MNIGRLLLLALLPAGGNLAGALIAEAWKPSRRALGLVLHAAAGVLLAVIGIELMPPAMETGPAWAIVLALMAGALFYIAVDWLVDGGAGENQGAKTPWGLVFATAVDLFSDGVMIGTGSLIRQSLGVLLAVAQVPADLPQGFATQASMEARGIPKARRIWISASFVIPLLAGAFAGRWILAKFPVWVQHAALAFTAGALMSLVIEEMVKQAHETTDSRWAALALVSSFALVALITSYLGG